WPDGPPDVSRTPRPHVTGRGRAPESPAVSGRGLAPDDPAVTGRGRARESPAAAGKDAVPVRQQPLLGREKRVYRRPRRGATRPGPRPARSASRISRDGPRRLLLY